MQFLDFAKQVQGSIAIDKIYMPLLRTSMLPVPSVLLVVRQGQEEGVKTWSLQHECMKVVPVMVTTHQCAQLQQGIISSS